MSAALQPDNIFRIVDKHRPREEALAKVTDFSIEPDGRRDEIDIRAPNVTLYCLDSPNSNAVLVETPVGLDLSDSAFFYQSQFTSARRVYTMSYDELFRAAGRLAPLDQLIFIYSVPRSGSTLLSKVFHLVDDWISLSEPDIFTELTVLLRRSQGSDVSGLRRLLDAALCLMGRNGAEIRPRAAIKFRSIVSTSWQLFHQLRPEARLVFIYRDIYACVESQLTVFGEETIRLLDDTRMRLLHPIVSRLNCDVGKALGLLTRPVLRWLSPVQDYLDMRERGAPVAAVRYEDLVACPRKVVMDLFHHCGISSDYVEASQVAFKRDAQRGSIMESRKEGTRRLTDGEKALIRQFVLNETSVPLDVLPGTLGLG